MTNQARRHPLLILVAVLCAAAIGGLFVAVLQRSLQTSNADAEVARLERQGVVYMHPLTTLVGELVESQSAAVSGQPVDKTALTKALDGVGRVDAEVGASLQTQRRYSELRSAVEAAMAKQSSPAVAYQTYSVLVGLGINLIQRVSDTSRLTNDRDLDSYYLMDAALVQLPAAMVYAGRATDLVTLAAGEELGGEDLMRAAVARYGVAAAAEQVGAGLSKSVDLTERTQLGGNIANQLDQFRVAVDTFAPPTMLNQLASGMTAKALGAAAKDVFATALPFTHRLLSELDALLAAREDRLVADARFANSAAQSAIAVAVILLLAILVTLVRGRLADRRAKVAAETPAKPASGRVSIPSGLTDPRSLSDPRGLTDPRDLLDQSGDLVAAGWPTRPTTASTRPTAPTASTRPTVPIRTDQPDRPSRHARERPDA